MHSRHLLARAMAALLTIGALLGAAAPIGAATPAGAPGRAATAADPLAASSLADFGQPFHFLPPLGVESGDPSKFDPSLINDLVVTICRVEGSSCTLVKTITSSSSLAERLRIGSANGIQSFYQANWDTSGFKLTPSTFRITVTVDRLALGSVDESAAAYKSFPRTWPIKFRIEKNPIIRVRQLHEAGKGASQIANAIRLEFGICGDDLVQLLTDDLEPFTQQEASLAVAGVCQAADIPSTTKVADPATQDALTSFDTTTGRLTFSSSTPTLNNLKGGDILVSEPSTAAPNGYLRKVTAITKNKKTGVVTVDTADALINEAIRSGTLDAAGDLEPGDLLSTQTAQGVTFRAGPTTRSGAGAPASGLADVGDGFDFHETIDKTFDGSTGDPDIGGNGSVHIQGELKFNAGWNVGMGIESCLEPPIFTCVDRFETHVGAHMYSNIKVDGTFTGHLHKDYILSTHYFKPIIFFIGPIPVVLVPVVNAIVGIQGDARVTFHFEATTTADIALGGKWTDPDDNGVGWANVSTLPTGTATGDADASATMEIHGYGAFDAKLLLYGILGPGLTGRAGLYAKVQFPGDPLWDLSGFANSQGTFKVSIGGVMDLGGWESDVVEAKFHIKSAENQKPTCSGTTEWIPAAPDKPVYLGPRTDGSFGGYFSCADPEGFTDLTYVGKEGSTVINLGAAKWPSGDHDVVVTATDDHGLTSDPITLHVRVNDTPPILSTTEAGGSVKVGVQYFVTASAWDVEGGKDHLGGFLPCTAMAWDVTSGTFTKAVSNQTCTVAVVFSATGFQTIHVRATEGGGKFSDHTITVLVGSAPANAAPVIDMDEFDVIAVSGPKTVCPPFPEACHEACPTGFFCMVPMDAILFNGSVGDFHPPLTLSVAASDPNGDPLTVHWFCQVGAYSYAVKDNGDGTFECDPYSSTITTPILIWATVSDGTTTVRTEVRRLYMLDRLA